MPLVDLGGVPAFESCAQLGVTPDFERLNRLEVACYRAALVVHHGPPPDGCALGPAAHAHDFGTYRTLVLAVEERLTADAHRYRDVVEPGLTSWLEAGSARPPSISTAPPSAAAATTPSSWARCR